MIMAAVKEASILPSKTLKSGKLEEAESSIQDACMKTFSVMSINMGGKANVNLRRQASMEAISQFSPSVIFCQELPGKFEKEVVNKCDDYDIHYDFRKTGTEAAVLWLKKDFELIKPIRPTKIVEKLALKRSDLDVSEVSSRSVLVILKEKGEEARGCQPFLAASWHGPRLKPKTVRESTLDGLICILCEVCRENGISSFILGGDFNINTSDFKASIDTVIISKYDLTPRAASKVQKGRKYIPYKDTFFVFNERSNDGILQLSSVSALSLKNCKDGLDHDPIVGEFTFGPCKQTGEPFKMFSSGFIHVVVVYMSWEYYVVV